MQHSEGGRGAAGVSWVEPGVAELGSAEDLRTALDALQGLKTSLEAAQTDVHERETDGMED